MILVIASVILLVAILAVVLWKREKADKKSPPPKPPKPSPPKPRPKEVRGENYINPTDFSVGVMKGAPCIPSDSCGSKVLYPLSNPDVDYGSKMPAGCPCDQFLESP